MSAMCTGRIECSLKTKFSLCIGHFAGYELIHFTLSVLFVLRGETTPGRPGVTHSLAHFLCLCMTQSQQESISGQATWQTGLGKSKERHMRNLLTGERQAGKMSNCEKKASVSSLKF